MDNRIKINKKEGESLEITIKAFYDDKKQKMLILWLVLFSLCGLAIISQFFENYEPTIKVFLGVYLAFWLFFEFKVIYAYRWRKNGVEIITINKEELILTKNIGDRGVTQHYNRKDINKIDHFKNENSSFISAMNNSYWNINKYQLAIFIENKTFPFGIDLTNKEAKNILNQIRKF